MISLRPKVTPPTMHKPTLMTHTMEEYNKIIVRRIENNYHGSTDEAMLSLCIRNRTSRSQNSKD